MTRCLMKVKEVPNQFWCEASRHATYIINRTPTRALVGVTPYEKFYGQKPNLERLKVFGCVAYERIVSKHLKKLDDRSRPLVYFGKEPGSGGVRLFNPEENKIIISCNELHEGRGSKKSESGTFVIPWLVTSGHVPPNPSATEPTAMPQEPVVASLETTSPQSATSPAAEAQTSTESETNNDRDPSRHNELENNSVRRSNRVSVMPIRLHDYELNM
ncbi:hypothetical protein OSB04_028809 [Centaurea solstitialis]|uniref:Retroviral polymerase SH3-like domain-containing protein n=1 Tax=Centaurea solstitialis TaxID=347529 RepID=A0AA38T193_9ASTR|nr:hypothetical protein OSB04_028809 [Centaurea solstitialis]